MQSNTRVERKNMKKRVTMNISEKNLALLDQIRGLVARSTFVDKFFDRFLTLQTGKEVLENNKHD